MAGLHSGHHCSSHSSCMQAYLYREIELVMAQCTKFIEAKGIGTGARGSDVVNLLWLEQYLQRTVLEMRTSKNQNVVYTADL